MDCKKGGFVTNCHNEIRNLKASMLSEVRKDVSIEPTSQPLTGEHYRHRTSDTDDNARLDVKVRGIWRRGQTAFFGVRVTHVNAQSHRNLTTDQVLKNGEQEKKRAYNDRIINVENGTFTPLIFGTNGAMGDEYKKFHKELALKLSTKRSEKYSSIMNWIRTRIHFSIIRSALLCLRGTRVIFYTSAPITEHFEFPCAEANMQNHH